jgi:hypothetical protein
MNERRLIIYTREFKKTDNSAIIIIFFLTQTMNDSWNDKIQERAEKLIIDTGQT